MRDLYFVISQFDTDANVDVYDKEGLIKQMKEWNEVGVDDPDKPQEDYIMSIDELEEGNPAEWNMKRLIIKGRIIVPRPKKVVETFEID